MDIKKDIEFIDNQVNYLERYHESLLKEWRRVKGAKWSGIAEDDLIYMQLDRWIKFYEDLKIHLQKKSFAEEEMNTSISKLPSLFYTKMRSFEEDEASKFKRVISTLLVFPRKLHYKKKLAELKLLIDQMGEQVYSLKKLRYKIEGYYFDDL
jgi:hypothetical protein